VLKEVLLEFVDKKPLGSLCLFYLSNFQLQIDFRLLTGLVEISVLAKGSHALFQGHLSLLQSHFLQLKFPGLIEKHSCLQI